MKYSLNFLQKISWWSYVALPLSYLYQCIIFIRKKLYQKNIFSVYRSPKPIIIIGSITIGGSGKTSVLIAIANKLKKKGFCVGIVSRGYGGRSNIYPLEVTSISDPNIVGDESVLIARHVDAPFFIDPNRPNAVKRLLSQYDCDVILSDDGLQHYALGRDIEIAVIDGKRRLGNGLCLPSGPLREPAARLKEVDFVLAQGKAAPNEYAFHYVFNQVQNVADQKQYVSFDFFQHKKIHAVAAIGDPERFFSMLREKGLEIIPHAFSDHYLFQEKDFDFANEDMVIMTEKDAVKCFRFAKNNFWFVPTEIELSEIFFSQLMRTKILNSSF